VDQLTEGKRSVFAALAASPGVVLCGVQTLHVSEEEQVHVRARVKRKADWALMVGRKC